MLAKLHTFSLLDIDALPVEGEVDVSPGAIPKTILVGMPEQAVKKSTHCIERARSTAASSYNQAPRTPSLHRSTCLSPIELRQIHLGELRRQLFATIFR